jgi:hypothetical protein
MRASPGSASPEKTSAANRMVPAMGSRVNPKPLEEWTRCSRSRKPWRASQRSPAKSSEPLIVFAYSVIFPPRYSGPGRHVPQRLSYRGKRTDEGLGHDTPLQPRKKRAHHRTFSAASEGAVPITECAKVLDTRRVDAARCTMPAPSPVPSSPGLLSNAAARLPVSSVQQARWHCLAQT